jgi:membrane peptidoglycan carboxypeptidase
LAIGTLASGGIKTEPYFIVKVVDKNGKVLESNILKKRSFKSADILHNDNCLKA